MLKHICLDTLETVYHTQSSNELIDAWFSAGEVVRAGRLDVLWNWVRHLLNDACSRSIINLQELFEIVEQWVLGHVWSRDRSRVSILCNKRQTCILDYQQIMTRSIRSSKLLIQGRDRIFCISMTSSVLTRNKTVHHPYHFLRGQLNISYRSLLYSRNFWFIMLLSMNQVYCMALPCDCSNKNMLLHTVAIIFLKKNLAVIKRLLHLPLC
jgi:hypothetical protein